MGFYGGGVGVRSKGMRIVVSGGERQIEWLVVRMEVFR